MSFSCPPSELVSHTLETLSFSGQFGLSLVELWTKLANKLMSHGLDGFQKQIIWQWLFFFDGANLQLYVTKNNKPLSILPNYAEFVTSNGNEIEIRVLPTSDTQWKYLTGLDASKKLRAQLGEKPFQLLCEIAKHGSIGIISTDLCKATGQDPRSLPSRFKRLTEMGFIKRKSIYHEKTRQHTNLCVHSKFSDEKSIVGSNEFQNSRSTNNLRQLVVQSVRNAPNNLRGFNDLKRELDLDKNKSASKFFGAIVEALHKSGYVEKLMVKEPEDERLVYSIKYLKDLPKDLINSSDYVELFVNLGDSADDEIIEDKSEDKEKLPLVNNFFPISNQIYQQIASVQSVGTTSKSISKNLSGISSFRPWTRMLDAMTSYIVDDNILIPLKSCQDEYNDTCVIRAYDFQGKYKYYRYFSRNHYLPIATKAHSSKRIEIAGIATKSLKQLNSSLFKALGKTPRGELLKSRKRQSPDMALNPAKKQKSIKSVSTRSRSSQGGVRTSTSEEVESFDNMESSRLLGASSQPILIDDVEPIVPQIKQTAKSRKSEGKQIIQSSLKGKKRRSELLEIVKDLGGVTYTTAKLRRLLDERIGSATVTDNKTLARDISILISNKDLEVRNISFSRIGQSVTRKLLILTDLELRPSDDEIEKVRQQCLSDHGERASHPVVKRIIESEVTLFQSTKPTKKKSKGRGRLDSLGESVIPTGSARRKRTALVPSANASITESPDIDSVKLEVESVDVLPVLVSKKHRRRRIPIKKTVEKGASRPPRRLRINHKFDKSDATTLFRAVVISKTFTRSSIDFAQIASLFEDMDAKSIKQKWTVVRKSVGGLQAVVKGIEAFEHIVMKGIEDELVSADDLECVKFSFFLDLWKDSDSTVLEIADKTPLYTSIKDNQDDYSFIETQEVSSDLFEQLEDNSMRQKDAILSGITFFLVTDTLIHKQENDDLRSVLKAIFSTSEENFSGARVKQILSQFGDDVTHQASSALIKDKEMIYYGSDDSNSRFVLTDKVYNALSSKLSSKFLNQAAQFHENILSVAEASRGLVISQNILNGQMATLLNHVANKNASLIHIDKMYQFEGYESRLIDKDKLACDIVAISQLGKDPEPMKKVPVPTGKACSHIWLDLNGNINEQLWIRLINAILNYIHFRPGIPEKMIFNKMQTILGTNDFECVMQWLVDSSAISKKYHGYWTNSNWYSIIGY